MTTLTKPEKNRQALGQDGEKLALRYLSQQGLVLIECNFRRPFGEIDLIMQDRATLVFVEVRSREKKSVRWCCGIHHADQTTAPNTSGTSLAATLQTTTAVPV